MWKAYAALGRAGSTWNELQWSATVWMMEGGPKKFGEFSCYGHD